MNQGSHLGLHKINVACKTCDVAESFYSSLSVKRFMLEHVSHEVVEGSPDDHAPPGTTDETASKVRLLKVLVELVMLPKYSSPVFTITGVKDDMKSAFIQVVPPSQRDQVSETLEKGKYLDGDSGEIIYVWDQKAVSFSEDAKLAMSFGAAVPEGQAPATTAAGAEDAPASNDRYEVHIASTGGPQTALAIQEEQESVVKSEPSAPQDADSIYPAVSPPAAQDAEEPAAIPLPERISLRKPARQSEGPVTVVPSGEAAVAAQTSQTSQEAEEDDYLLVSRSWYIEERPKNRSEAVRISKLLRPFRWKIEPAYTIGVIVDDILSVESANGEIDGEMTKKVESAGYKLSRVSVEKGKPVAWFKKEPTTA